MTSFASFVVLALIYFQLALSTDICKEKDKIGFKLKLLGTALFKDHLLMISNDGNGHFTVYRIPISNFDNSYGQMLINIEGVPIEQYWPIFKTDPTWKEIANKVITIWLIDKVKPYLYFTVTEMEEGKTLDVENGTWAKPRRWAIHKDKASQIISDASTEHAYSNKNIKDVYLMYIWKVALDSTGQYDKANTQYREIGHMYYTENIKTKQKENVTFVYGTAFDYVVTPDTDPYRKMAGYENYRIVNLTDWAQGPSFQPPGYVFKGYFHIFDPEYVFIFEDMNLWPDPKLKPGEIVNSAKLLAIPVKDYFKCHKVVDNVTYPPRNQPVDAPKTGSKSWLWIILVIIVVLILLALLACLCFYYQKGGKRKRKAHGSSHGHARNSSHKKDSSLKHKSTHRKVTDAGNSKGSLKRKTSMNVQHSKMATVRSGVKLSS